MSVSTRGVRPTTQIDAVVSLDPVIAAALRTDLADVADRAVLTIIEEVPSYAGALSGDGWARPSATPCSSPSAASSPSPPARTCTPMAPALEGAYQLGRGEARSGRSDRGPARGLPDRRPRRRGATCPSVAVDAGVDAEQLGRFAELVFAYIDELSAASASPATPTSSRAPAGSGSATSSVSRARC